MKISDASRNILPDANYNCDSVNTLMIAGFWQDAISICVTLSDYKKLCHAFISLMAPHTETQDEKALLSLINEWASNPRDEVRREIFARAEDIGFSSASAMFSLAVFWSQGSMTPHGVEDVYPDKGLAVMMAGYAFQQLTLLRCGDHPPELAAQEIINTLTLKE